MGDSSYKIYCAGPLFNPKEKEEMAQIAFCLEKNGYSVFLPQRDGLEFAELFPIFLNKGIEAQIALKILNMAIFSLDAFQVITSDGLVLNMNGRVPDEGSVVEAGIAWAHNKIVVIFKSDLRSLVQGNCNPMILGLGSFSFVNNYDEIVDAFNSKFSSEIQKLFQTTNSNFDTTTRSGKEISKYLTTKKSDSDVADLLIYLFREKACKTSEDQKQSYFQAGTQR